jgi:cation diffusion facilitator CzcD-associated flavoprotein CzcO
MSSFDDQCSKRVKLEQTILEFRFVVIGGGIAGVCCAQELSRLLGDDEPIALVSASSTVMEVRAARMNWLVVMIY